MPSPHAPTKYLGPQVFYPATVSRNRRPTSTDVIQPETGKYYIITSLWQVGKQPTTGTEGEVWILTKIVANVAFWELFTSAATGTVVGLIDNFGTEVLPSSSGFINLITANTTVKFTGVTPVMTQDFGLSNLILGSNGSGITSATFNVGVGMGCLAAITSSPANVGVGFDSLNTITGGSGGNVGVGHRSLFALTTGSGNIGIGISSLETITGTVSNNTAIGSLTLNHLVGGSYNIALGYTSGSAYFNNETSNILISNVGLASENNAIRIGTSGTGNGQQDKCYIAGIAGVTVSNTNIVTIDTEADQLGSIASTAFGQTITGDDGVALSPSGGNWNIITGLSTHNSGSSIQFTGSGSTLKLNVTDSSLNTLIGNFAGNNTLLFSGNTGLGYGVLTALTSGGDCVAIGASTGPNVTTGTYNCLVGTQSAGLLTTGNSNSFFGSQSGNSLLTGSYNVIIGALAGSSYVGAESSNILISNYGMVTTDNHVIRIGTQGTGNGQQSSCYIAGIVGNTVSSASLVTTDTAAGVNQGQMGVITTSNNGVLITNNSGVPSWLANSATPGFVLTANSGAPPSWKEASSPEDDGLSQNLGMTYSAGTFKITDISGNTLSSTNPAYVSIPSSANPGQILSIKIVQPYQILDYNSGSSQFAGWYPYQYTGNNWNQDRPFFLYAILNSTPASAPAFGISLNPTCTSAPSSGLINTSASIVSQAPNSFFLLDINTGTPTAPTVANYAGNPCVLVGSFRMQTGNASTNDWAIQTLGNTDGIGLFQQGIYFTMPQGVMNAVANSFFLPNGGTAPSNASNRTYIYKIDLTGMVYVLMNYTGNANAGAGSVTTNLSTPYPGINSFTPCGVGILVNPSGFNQIWPCYVNTGDTRFTTPGNTIQFIYNNSTSNLLLNSQIGGSGAYDVRFTAQYLAFNG